MIYHVKVKPGSSQEKIITESDDTLIVYLHATPHDGSANAALIKLLSKEFKVPKTSIKILRGAHSREKVIEL